MSTANEPIFFQKYIVPGLALFFTWGLVAHLLLINLDLNALQKNKGTVSKILVIKERGRNTYFPLNIALKDNDKVFRLPDTYTNAFSILQKKIILSDTITIYTRNRWQTILGWGMRYDIYQIDKNNETLFSLTNVIEENKTQAKILAIFCIILWTWYIIYRWKRINN